MRVRMSRRKRSSAWIVICAGLGIYVVLAAAFNRFVEPTVAQRSVAALVAEQMPAATFPARAPSADIASAAQAPSAQVELPAHFVAKPRPIAPASVATAAVTKDANSAAAEPRRPARRQASRSGPRYERPWGNSWGSWHSYASGPSNFPRRWF